MKQRSPEDHPIRWAWSRSGPRRYGVLLLSFFALWQAANALLLPLVFRVLIDGAIEGDRAVFLPCFGIYCGVFFLQTALDTLSFHVCQRTIFQMETSIRGHLFQGLLHTEYASLSQHSLGELQNHLNDDVSIAVNAIVNIPPVLLSLVVRVVGASVILLLWDWRFFLLYTLLILVLLVGMAVIRGPMQSLHRAIRQTDDGVQAVQQDTLRNTVTVQTFFAYHSAMSAWRERVEQARQAIYRQNIFSNLLRTGYSLVTDLGYLGCLLWYGAGVIGGAVTYGTLASALQLVAQIQNPFSNLTQMFSQYTAMLASTQRLIALEALPKDPVGAAPGSPDLPGLDHIQISHLSFCYGDLTVLEDVSLTIRKGDFIAFTGLSGAGKSTLLKVLLSLYHPTRGSVTLYDEQQAAVPLSPVLRGLFAYVPQGNAMMAGTIEQAVSFRYHQSTFTPEDRERIRYACTVACAHDFIQALPLQYDTLIGEGGIGLSEGQLQRLAIARAIFHQAPILLLDEATSALDEETERQVLANIRSLSSRTVLIVTHRPQALSVCNRVVRVEETRLYEEASASTQRP